jgi:hypothetical protein
MGAPFIAAAEKVPPPPPDLDGRGYTTVYPTEDKKPKDKITFADGKLVISTLKDIEFKYKAKVKANGKGVVSETQFSATTKTDDGVTYEVSGAVMLNGEIRGSIIRREKDMDATARNFNGKQSSGKK